MAASFAFVLTQPLRTTLPPSRLLCTRRRPRASPSNRVSPPPPLYHGVHRSHWRCNVGSESDTNSEHRSSVAEGALAKASAMRGRPYLWRKRALVAAAICACVALIAVIGRSGAVSNALQRAEALIASVGLLRGSCMLFALNFCTVLFCFPANIGLMIASAAVLGAAPAFLALLSSKFLAACVAFQLGRGVLASRAKRALAAQPRIGAALDAAGAGAGWRFVLLARLSPLPGFALNYLLSVTQVSFRQYALGTALGIIPSVANLCLIGAAARDVSAVAVGATVTTSWLAMTVRAFCMASMLIVSVMATRRARSVFAALKTHDGVEQPRDVGHADVENGLSTNCDASELASAPIPQHS